MAEIKIGNVQDFIEGLSKGMPKKNIREEDDFSEEIELFRECGLDEILEDHEKGEEDG